MPTIESKSLLRQPIRAMISPPLAEPLSLMEQTDVTIDELETDQPDYPFELINGKVVKKMASPQHGELGVKITLALGKYLEKNPIGTLFYDVNYRLSPNNPLESRAPDLSFIKTERLPKNELTYPAEPPDLAIEIVSTHDRMNDVFDKAALYIASGVQEVWLIIPQTREILIYTPKGISGARDTLTTEVLPGFELKVKALFEK